MESKTILLLTFLICPGVLGETTSPKDNRSQIPIFLDQHMIKAISENIDNDKLEQPVQTETTQTISEEHNKDGNDLLTKNPSQLIEGDASSKVTKSEDKDQVPIFMDQHMFNVVNKDLLKDTADNKESVEETTEEPKEHQMPIFMNQQMVKEIVDLQKSRPKQGDPNHGGQNAHVIGTTPQIPIRIPEPQEHYKNSIYLEGHHYGNDWHASLVALLSSAMATSREMSYRSENLAVYPLSTTWEFSSGHEVTHVVYIVTYNGGVLAEYEVTHTLSRPRPSEYLHHGLQNMHLTQHQKANTEAQTQSNSEKTYMTPALIAGIALAATLLLLILVLVIYVRRARVSPPKSKNKKELMKYILEADKRRSNIPVEPIKPPAYSENPAYEV